MNFRGSFPLSFLLIPLLPLQQLPDQDLRPFLPAREEVLILNNGQAMAKLTNAKTASSRPAAREEWLSTLQALRHTQSPIPGGASVEQILREDRGPRG
jgi:hypothetical protein